MAAPRKLGYRADLFSVTSLDDVENAILEFLPIVTAANVERIMSDVLCSEQPVVARLAIAAVDKKLLLDKFPTKPEDFQGTIAATILEQLATFFVLAHPIPTLHAQHYELVKDAPGLLALLSERIANLDVETEPTQNTSSKRGKAAAAAASQKARKKQHHSRRANEENALNIAPFERLSIPLPSTREQLEQALALVLTTQQSIFETYLDSLKLPAVIESIKLACLPTAEDESEDAQQTEGSPTDDAEQGVALDIVLDDAPLFKPSASLNLKFSDIFRKRISKFGDWDITIAPQAQTDFLALSKNDKPLFGLILKALRSLSKGQLSAKDQQINPQDTSVPIFKVPVGEKVIVYHVDCVAIDDENERQVIKVFGVYSEGQVGRGTFWESMGRELAKKGDEFTRRCTVRKPRITNDGTFAPEVFPYNRSTTGWEGVLQLPADDTEQILSLLLKTIHLSEDVLRSIINGLDVAFVLDICPEERKIVENNYSCYVLGRSGTGKTTTMLYKMLLIEASNLELQSPRSIRQLFVTKSRTLADKVGEHFMQLLGGYRPAAVARNLAASKTADRVMLAKTERENLRTDLPTKFSELQDSDFPLFISFEQLCSMIEADVAARAESGNEITRLWLTYDKFKNDYWPHFPQNWTKGLDPAMIFSELMGVILGSEAALESKHSHLDRDAYLAFRPRLASSTSEAQKSRIYDLFERYLEEKRRTGDLDVADRTRMLLEDFRRNGVPGQKVDFLYVDEVQDNLLVDTLLLRSICHNRDGLFWAGDTAQSISAGSSFRFKELKAFLHRVEGRNSDKQLQIAQSMRSVPPKMFQLTTNYRSHAGIVNCARTIVETITKLWPGSIDKLHPERATVDGLKPMFFNNWDADNVQSSQFLFGDQTSGARIDFGAQQCILVRDKQAKERLERIVGNIGIVMSLYDAKGLEFNDILLYDFFADSEVEESQWRVVLNMVGRDINAPTPDIVKHASVCMELKFLYVAVTRARNNLWIADSSTKGEPMRTLWTSRDQVQNCTLGKDTPRFAISSTPEEWRARGWEFWEKCLYANARLCFERALMPFQARVCAAYDALESAKSTSVNDAATRRAKFVESGVKFQECGRDEKVVTTSHEYFALAGESFEYGGDLPQAIVAFRSAEKFDNVALLYRTLAQFDEAIDTIQQYDVTPSVAERVRIAARLFYFKNGQFTKALALFDNNEDAAIAYLKSRGLPRAALLKELGLLSEAAEAHAAEGRFIEAIKLFLKDNNIDRAAALIIERLWKCCPFATRANHDCMRPLMQLCDRIDWTRRPSVEKNEISMFPAIIAWNQDTLLTLAHEFMATKNAAAALVCLDHYFGSRGLNAQDLDPASLVRYLDPFLAYCKHLHLFAFGSDGATSDAWGRLFGYSKQGDDRFSVHTNSILHRPTTSSAFTPDSALIISGAELKTALDSLLQSRLVAVITQESRWARVNKVFEGPCLTYALYNTRCNRHPCRQEHIDMAAYNAAAYNLRVRAHLLQILIYQGLPFRYANETERRLLLSRLYSVLNPPSFRLGSRASIDWKSIPETALGFRIVGEWLRKSSHTLDFDPNTHFLTTMSETVQLAFQFHGTEALAFLTQGRFMRDVDRIPAVYRRPANGAYIVSEFLRVVEDQEEWSLSAGVEFVNHVLSKSLPIQVNTICHIVENLAAGFVIGCRQPFWALHDITLPLSWLLKRATGAGLGARRDARSYCRMFVGVLVTLSRRLLLGEDGEHLQYESRHLGKSSTIGALIRHAFLLRTFRSLCLIAYNFRDSDLKTFVLSSISSMAREAGNVFPFITAKFCEAREWSDLAWAVRNSTHGSPHDEMVMLVQADRVPLTKTPTVRQIVYRTQVELLVQLGIASAALRAAAPPPAPISNAPTTLTPARPPPADDEQEDPLPEHVTVELPALADSAPASFSQDEISAARTLEKFFLRVLARNKRQAKSVAAAPTAAKYAPPAVVQQFLVCREMIEYPGSGRKLRDARMYVKRVWGPLPHLLACLSAANDFGTDEAKGIAREFATAAHETYESLEQRMAIVEATLNGVKRLRDLLGPTYKNNVHACRDYKVLEQFTQSAIDLLRNLPFALPAGVHLDAHLKIVEAAILGIGDRPPKRKTPKKSLRPSLDMAGEWCEDE